MVFGFEDSLQTAAPVPTQIYKYQEIENHSADMNKTESL